MQTAQRTDTKRSHSYTIDGKPVPGVTTILGQKNKPALVAAAVRATTNQLLDKEVLKELFDSTFTGNLKNYVDELARTYRQTWNEKATLGSQAHELAYRTLSGQTMTSDDIPVANLPHVLALDEWISDWQPRVILAEMPIYHRERSYAGTLDLLCEIESARLGEGPLNILIDFKTGGIFGETNMQLAAYRNTQFYIDPTTGKETPLPHIDGCAIVQLNQNATYNFISRSANGDDYTAFLACLNLWNWDSKQAQRPLTKIEKENR